MKKMILGGAAAAFALSSLFFMPVGQEDGTSVAEAAALRAADRELKRDKWYDNTDLGERIHHIIWGSGKAYDDRPRIAVVINGDENIIVEDRVKNQIYSQLRKKFPREDFAVMKGVDVNTKLLQYAEEMYYNQRETAETQENSFETKSSSLFGSVTGHANRSMGWFDDDYTGTRNIQDNRNSNNTYDSYLNPVYDANGNLISNNEHRLGTNNRNSNRTVGINDVGNVVGNTEGTNVGVSGTVGIGSKTESGEWSRVRKPSQVDVDGMPVGMQPRGLADMQRMDYVRAGKDCNYDYVFVLSFSNGKSKVYSHNYLLFNTHSIDKNVWLRIRVVDVKSGDYIYRNDIVAMGKTSNGHVNGRVIERSVKSAVQEALDDLEIDYYR